MNAPEQKGIEEPVEGNPGMKPDSCGGLLRFSAKSIPDRAGEWFRSSSILRKISNRSEEPEMAVTAPDLFTVDLHYSGMPCHSSAYIIRDRESAIIETGTALAVPFILDALKESGIEPEGVRYVIVTHIHLDHAGGAGALLEKLPNALLVVHPAGVRHLIDPTGLLASASRVYGSRFDSLFGTMVPVPEERIIPSHQGLIIQTGRRTLELFEAPGHSYHHLIIHSPADRAFFTGDAAGLLFVPFRARGLEYTLISTSPTQFNPDQMDRTLAFMMSFKPERLFYTHFGPSQQAQEQLERARILTGEYLERGMEALKKENPLQSLAGSLRLLHCRELAAAGIGEQDPLVRLLEHDIELNAQGILHYLRKPDRHGAATEKTLTQHS